MAAKKKEVATVETGAMAEFDKLSPAQLKVLREVVWPDAQNDDSIRLAYEYCRARQLDPLKRTVHIVPVWDSKKNKMRDTVWPSIAEVRTTAHRTGEYAGADPIRYGPLVKKRIGTADIEFPEWAEMTVYRLARNGERYPYTARVWWLEAYAQKKRADATPNSMWMKRKFGQVDKCAEAASLRMAFPEELGGVITAEEMVGKPLHDDDTAAAYSVADKDAGHTLHTEQQLVSYTDFVGEVQEGFTVPEFLAAMQQACEELKAKPDELGTLWDNNGESLDALHKFSPTQYKGLAEAFDSYLSGNSVDWDEFSKATDDLIAAAKDDAALKQIESSDTFKRAAEEAPTVHQYLVAAISDRRNDLGRAAPASKAKKTEDGESLFGDDEESGFNLQEYIEQADVKTPTGKLSKAKFVPWLSQALDDVPKDRHPDLIVHFGDAIDYVVKLDDKDCQALAEKLGLG